MSNAERHHMKSIAGALLCDSSFVGRTKTECRNNKKQSVGMTKIKCRNDKFEKVGMAKKNILNSQPISKNQSDVVIYLFHQHWRLL